MLGASLLVIQVFGRIDRALPLVVLGWLLFLKFILIIFDPWHGSSIFLLVRTFLALLEILFRVLHQGWATLSAYMLGLLVLVNQHCLSRRVLHGVHRRL